MSLKKLLLDQVPSNVQQEPQFSVLLDHIKEHSIENKEHLRKFISQQVDIVEGWIQNNKGVANIKTVKAKATHLEMLRKFDDLTNNFL